jgi:RimJ/RimL family protein N-acetyltransferase
MYRADATHPLGRHHEIGWRLCRAAWGKGIASNVARRALLHAWGVVADNVIYSYTAPDNLRSQAVMARLGLLRKSQLDFTADYPLGPWTGWVWTAERPTHVRD